MKKSNIFVLSFIILLIASPAFSVSVQIENGTNYLISTQNQSGSWYDTVTSSNSEFFSTIAVLDSFKQLGMDNALQYQTGVQWIQSQTTENTAYIANRIYILSNAGVDVTADINTLLSYRNTDGGWGISLNYKSNNFHTALALQALKAANYSDQNIIGSAIAYLKSAQNPDGGWAFRQAQDDPQESNVYMTAVVLNTLSQFETIYALNIQINNAVIYLLAHQNADGGFGGGPSTIIETALSFEALIASGAVGADKAANIQNAINYLYSTQLPNGSWDDDPYSTALALRALNITAPPPTPQLTTGTVTGQIVDGTTNQSLSGASVVLQSDNNINTPTNAAGYFTLSNIPAGSQNIGFSLPGYLPASVTLNITAGSLVDLGAISLTAIPTTGIIKGTVTDAANSQPLSGVTITVSGSFSGQMVTGIDGAFNFINVTPGNVTLSAMKSGHYTVTGTGIVAAGGTLFFNPQLSTEPPPATTGSLKGRILDCKTDAPVVGAVITIQGGQSGTTDTQGAFLITDIPPGTYQITTTATAYYSRNYQEMIMAGVTTDMQTLYLTASPPFTTINGRVTDAITGSPVDGAGVSIVGTSFSAITADDGGYSMTGITVLEFDIKASAPGYETASYHATTTGYGTYSLNFSLKAPQLGNLKAGGLTFSNSAPTQGEIVTISAVIYNTGFSQTPDASARFYDGDPNNGGTQIGAEQTIPSLSPNSSATIQITYDTAGKTGRHDVFVVADPLNAVSELDETDNLVTNALTILKPVDLAIDSKDIVYFPFDPIPDTAFIIAAFVRNLGERPLENVAVALYDGNPAVGGLKLEDKAIPLVNPQRPTQVSFELIGQSLGTHNYYISVDPDDRIIETDKSNNQGSVSIEIEDPNNLSSTTDLYLAKADITFNPTFPVKGQNVTITAVVHNRSALRFNYNVYVSFYNGDPNQGGALLGTVTTSLSEWGQQAISFNWKMPDGTPVIYVVIDKDNKIKESDKTNNIAYRPINTYSADLSVTEKDINLDPILPARGQPTTLNITVNNLGNISGSGTVSVYEVDLEGRRTPIGAADVSMGGAGKSTASMSGWTYPDKSGTIAVVLDNVSPGDPDLSNNEVTVTYGESTGPGSNNEGKEFWIAYPQSATDSQESAQIVVQSEVSTQVTIAGRYLYWTGMVSPGAPAAIPYIHYDTWIYSNGIVEDRGIHITSDGDISVIFKVPAGGAVWDDAYLAVPTKSLGAEYYNITYDPIYNNAGSYSRITIAAAYDNTNVNLAGTLVNLNRGQTYQIKSNTTDYTGRYIRSDKPISVFAGVTCTFIPSNKCCCDTLLEQLLPVSLWGTDYLTAPLYSPTGRDFIRVLASEDNTEVTFKERYYAQSDPQTFTLNKGQWREFDVEATTHITGTKPIEVAQFAKGHDCVGVGDPFEMLIMPTDKFRTGYRFYVMTGFAEGNFATIIAPESQIAVQLDGAAITPLWQPLPDGGNYALLSLPVGEHTISADRPIAVYAHAYRGYGSYGYPAGFGVPLPDLAIQDLTLDPQNPSEGQLVGIKATLSNLGETARDILVRAFNGDPISGGIPLGEATVSILYPGGSASIEFSWDTYGYRGVNNIYVIADPLDTTGESDENNNVSFVAVNVAPALKPDPAVADTDITLSKDIANESETVILSAEIWNRGLAAGNIPVSLYLGDPDNGGALIDRRIINQIIPFHGAVTVNFAINTAGFNNTNDLFVVIDPDNVIDEISKANNVAVKQLRVNRGVVVEVGTDAAQYQADSEAGINVYIENNNLAPWSGAGDVYIEDLSGNQVAHVATFSINDLKPTGMAGWAYRIPLTVTAAWDMKDTLAEVRVDFIQILQSLGIPNKVIDMNSIRVLEMDGNSAVLGEKQARSVFQGATMAKITWLIDGLTPKDATRYFYVFFDIMDNGAKGPPQNAKLPQTGKLIAITYENGAISMLNNNGDGAFGSPVLIDSVTGSTSVWAIGLDDFNNDGFLDMVVGGGDAWYGAKIYYYKNRGDGSNTFYPKMLTGSTGGTGTRFNIVTADFNNDGNKDFVMSGKSSGSFFLYKGKGDGTFTQIGIPQPVGTYYITGKAAADVDGDGKLDLIASAGNAIYYYKGKGDGTFFTPIKIAQLGDSPYGIALGDFDEDEKVDAMVNSGYEGYTYFLKGNGNGTFGTPTLVPSLYTGKFTAFSAGDFNNDDHLDIIAATYTNYTIEFFAGKGDGTFEAKTIIQDNLAIVTMGISGSPALAEVHPALGIAEAISPQFFTFTWNAGDAISGPYKIHVTLSDGQGVIAEDFAAFEIIADKTLNSKVVTDRVSYKANETATITSAVTSTSANYIFENLTAKIAISPAAGGSAGADTQQSAISLYTETKNIPILTPGQITEFKTYWNTAANPPGAYPVTLEITDSSGAVLATSATTLTISSDIIPSALLKGQISVDKQTILQGEPVNISYNITNVGNIDLPQIDLSVLTVHVVELTPYNTLTDQTALLMGQTYANTQQLVTQSYTAKDYLVILRASIAGVEETLAGTYFRVEGAPSAPSLSSPQQGSDVETLTPLFIVNNASDPNDDKLTYEFELYTDSGLSNLFSSSGALPEGIGTTSWTVPLALTENATYYWRARAYDGILYGDWMSPASFRINVANDPPTAPTLSSPADNSEVSTLSPVLAVNNASDPDSGNLTYNFDLALDADFTQRVASQVGIFEGRGTTSWQVPLSLNENTTYYWRAQADDWLITGPWMTTARFFVNTANDAPTAPVIITPSNGSEITTLYVDIAASNSTDPDSTSLTYVFEADTAATFDSSNLIRSGNITVTQWNIENLDDNTRYYVRAKASDGFAESPWSEVIGLFVNTVNEPPTTPVLANPSDGAGVNVFTPTLSVHNSTDIDRDVLTYEFEIYGDSTLTNLLSSGANIQETPEITSWTVPVNLSENMTYYWRARAFDGELNSDWTSPASFMVNTANDAPSAPSLHSPANGSSINTLTPTLSVYNAVDPDSDSLTYDFEIYSGGILIKSITGISQNISGVTSVTLDTPLSDDITYTWRARAYDGDRYGAWMDMAIFSIHLPVTSITATIDFDPNTLNKKSKGTWVVVYIELPSGYSVADIQIPTIRLNGVVPAEAWPYAVGDYDEDGIPDLMVKFDRNAVINLLPNGDSVQVHVTGAVGTTTFEGVDTIRVIP